MASRTIQSTKNYRLFKLSGENRPVNLRKHRRLKESMQKHGWLTSFPMSCVRDEKKHLVVKDGQHRLAFAEQLQIPVRYVVEEVDYDVAMINCTPEKWTLLDYAMKWANNGKKVYQEVIDFSEHYGVPLSVSISLLGGSVRATNSFQSYTSGKFKIADREWADQVASMYSALCALSSDMKTRRCLEACMSVCRVDGFNASRLLEGAKRCREKLAAYSTKDAYMDLLEHCYNFGRRQLFPLKIKAMEVMKERNPVKSKD